MGRWIPPAAVASAALLLLFGALGRSDLFNPDEPREAEIAREMSASGDFLVPHLNGDPFLEKPPLFYWLVCGAFAIAGRPGETAARFVPALCGLLCVLLTWFLGRDLVGERAALLGAAILLTSFQYLWTARRCMIDMPLTLAVLLACLALERALRSSGRARFLCLTASSLSMAAAVLLKGIVGAGIPALALLGALFLRRDARSALRPGIAAAGLGALLPAAVWILLLGRRAGFDAVREAVWVNNVLRFAGGAAKGHVQPWFYYAQSLLTDFAPWSLLLPFALAAALVALRRLEPKERGRVEFLLAWLMAPFLVLSFASTKRGIYLLPIFPAAALLVGWWLTRPSLSRPERAALGLLIGEVLAVALVFPPLLLLTRPGAGLAAGAACSVLLLVVARAYAAFRKGHFDRLALLSATCVGAAFLGLCFTSVPDIVNRHASPRRAASQARRMAEAGDHLALFRFKEGSLGAYLFYAGRTLPNLRTDEDLRLHLTAEPLDRGPRALAVMTEEAYAAVTERLGLETSIVWRFPTGLSPEWTASRSGWPRLELRPSEALVLVVARAVGPRVAGRDRGGFPSCRTS